MKKLLKVAFSMSMLLALGGSLCNGKSNGSNNNETTILEKPTVSKYGRLQAHLPVRHSSSDSKVKRATTDLPASYSSKSGLNYTFAQTEDYITSVKEQNHGDCWAHAASAASEASLIKHMGYTTSLNLSELHLVYYTYNTAYDAMGLLAGDENTASVGIGLDEGGFNYYSIMKYANWTGPVTESAGNSAFAYSKATNTFSNSNNAYAYSLDEVHLKNAYLVDTGDINLMKQMIMQYGAGDFAYYADGNNTFANNAVCIKQSATYGSSNFLASNHEVTVVGWDDNFSKSKFTTKPSVSDSHSGNTLSNTPTNNGAWLVKNSWGSSFGMSGYFWLSYEDSAMLAEPAAFFEFDSNTNYEHNYQYDGSINYISEYNGSSISTPNSFSGVSGGATIANVFTSQQSESLQAVSLYTWDDNLNYTVKIYKGVTGAPTTGTLVSSATTSGTLSYAGYNTIPLVGSVALSQGEKFAVAISLTGQNSSTRVVLPVDYTYADWGFYNSASSGQSYYSKNGSTSWTDVSSKGANFRIKAFTNEKEEPVTGVTISPTTTDVPLNGTTQLTATVAPADASNKTLTWSSANNNVATVDDDGLVTGVSTGTTTITVTTNDGGYTASATVTVKAIPVTGVSLTSSSSTVKVGKNITVTPTFTPSNASNQNVSYTSSDTLIASVSNTGVVTGVSEGSARITVTTADGGYTSYVDIQVTLGSGNYTLVENDSDLQAGDEIILVAYAKNNYFTAGGISSAYLSSVEGIEVSTDNEITNFDEINGIEQFTLGGNSDAWTLTNQEGKQLYSNAAKNVNYSSTGTGTWTISISSDGATIAPTTSSYGRILYNATSPRFTTYTSNTNDSMVLPNIYRLDGPKIAETGVTISQSTASIQMGDELQLTATVLPENASNKSVTWSTDNSSVATVSTTGLVTAHDAGTAVIKVTTQNGQYAECTVTVIKNATSVITEINTAKEEFAKTRSTPSDLSNIKSLVETAESDYNTLPNEDKSAVTNSKYIIAMNSAIDFLENRWYGVVRVQLTTKNVKRAADDWSICDVATNNTKAKELVSYYDNLSVETQEILKTTYDITASDGSNISVGQSIDYICNVLTANEEVVNSNSEVIRNTSSRGLPLIIGASLIIGVLLTSAVILIIKRKNVRILDSNTDSKK